MRYGTFWHIISAALCLRLCHFCFYLQGVYSVDFLECLPSWHRLRLWQRQCTTSPRGWRDLGPHGGWWWGWRDVGTRAKSREQDAHPPSWPSPPPLRRPLTFPQTIYQRACATSAEAVATASQPAWACINASPKAATIIKAPSLP